MKAFLCSAFFLALALGSMWVLIKIVESPYYRDYLAKKDDK